MDSMNIIGSELRAIWLVSDGTKIGIKLHHSGMADRQDRRYWLENEVSCCEKRYFECQSDNLKGFHREVITAIEVSPTVRADDGQDHCKDCNFLRIVTTKDTYVFACYNEHNGYYGGIDLKIYDASGHDLQYTGGDDA